MSYQVFFLQSRDMQEQENVLVENKTNIYIVI